ncbi:MAG: cupin domain-containing protein [Halobacteriaceae archaeon]
MSYETVSYHDVDPVAGGMYFLRDALDTNTVGLTVLECEPGWTGKEHDHADSEHEEIYYVEKGSVTIQVEGEAVELESGEAIRLDPETTRQIKNHDTESKLILVGAP